MPDTNKWDNKWPLSQFELQPISYLRNMIQFFSSSKASEFEKKEIFALVRLTSYEKNCCVIDQSHKSEKWGPRHLKRISGGRASSQKITHWMFKAWALIHPKKRFLRS